MMRLVATALGWVAFAALVSAVTLAPWMFGAWEMWWFWPFMAILLVAGLAAAVRFTISGEAAGDLAPKSRLLRTTILVYGVFILYCAVRAAVSPVHMDAERSFLLISSPVLIIGVILTAFSPVQVNLAFGIAVLNLFAVGLYGLMNHRLTGSSLVMWVTTPFTQYAGRASGPFYCPDHFSGAMEFLLAATTAVMLSTRRIWMRSSSMRRDSQGRTRDAWSSARSDSGGKSRSLAGWKIISIALAGVACVGIYFSQSRGGAIASAVLAAAAATIATSRLPLAARWLSRLALLVVASAMLWAFLNSPGQFAARFRELAGIDPSTGAPQPGHSTVRERVVAATVANSRYNMYCAALRVWQTAPWTGIGAGMHQHLWPHIAPTPDGDRATGRWPTRLNTELKSYEVHNDWLQLLEEYGVIGFALFAAACILLSVFLIGAAVAHADGMILAALLATLVIAVHSLVDFNLQIPANAWVFEVILGAGIYRAMRETGERVSE